MSLLVVTDGPANGKKFNLKLHRLATIGRDHVCTFQIMDDRISRVHLQIKHEESDQRHYAIDFGSANGVHVNDEKISTEVPLSNGDRIRIGSTTMVYFVEDSAETRTAIENLEKYRQRGLETKISD